MGQERSELAGKRIAVTGASAGIGRATAGRLARDGARLALIARSEGELQKLAWVIGDATAIPADVGVREEAESAVARAAERLGGLDCLVANAAATAYGPFGEIPPEDFRRTIEVTLFGVVDSVRAALPHLERSGGSVVVVGSIVRDVPMPLFTPYVAAKGALRAFTDSLRAELRSAGSPVAVSLVDPGPVDTGFWKGVDSATGEVPPVPHGAAEPERVAEKIAGLVAAPKPRAVVGPYAFAQRTFARLLPRVADRVLPLSRRYLGAGATPAEGPGSLWSPTGERTRPGRPS